MRSIIIDDEAMARMIITKLCGDHKNISVEEQFDNAIDAMKYLNYNKVDLIFLDMHMPNFNGIDFIQTIKEPPNVILTSSDPNFAIEAFEYDCIVDYLIKPVHKERFAKAISKAQITRAVTPAEQTKTKVAPASTEDALYVNIDRRLIKIDFEDIYLIAAKGDYIMIKTDKGNHIVHSTMKKIEVKLPDSLFLKIHRSYIINTKKIIDIEDNCVLIKKEVIPISRSNRPILMKRLNLL